MEAVKDSSSSSAGDANARTPSNTENTEVKLAAAIDNRVSVYTFASYNPLAMGATKNFEIAKLFSRYGSYNLEDILNCNELFNIITNKKLHSFISDYFECCATISNVNLYWTFPKFGDKLLRSRVSRYHRDLEDYKTAKIGRAHV